MVNQATNIQQNFKLNLKKTKNISKSKNKSVSLYLEIKYTRHQ